MLDDRQLNDWRKRMDKAVVFTYTIVDALSLGHNVAELNSRNV